MTCDVSCGTWRDGRTAAAQVDTMVSVCPKPSSNMDFILSQGAQVVKKDVDNIVQSHRTAVATKDDEAEAAKILQAREE